MSALYIFLFKIQLSWTALIEFQLSKFEYENDVLGKTDKRPNWKDRKRKNIHSAKFS